MTEASCFYRVFGLTVASEIGLPELPSLSLDAPPDVLIRRGEIGSGLAPGLSIAGDVALLNIEGIARFRITGGSEMVVEQHPGSSRADLRLYLLGSAFAAILHQRALLPLHANAVVIGGRAAAFMGHSGAGKSTLAAWFHDRGFPVLADDVCVVTEGAEGPVAEAGIPRLRLWRDALEASGRQAETYERSFSGLDKYTVSTAASGAGPVPLAAVYLLKRAEGAEASVERLEGAAAVSALVANTYRGAYVPMMGRTREHLQACVSLAKRVPVFAAHRQWSLEQMDEEAGRLIDHASSIAWKA